MVRNLGAALARFFGAVTPDPFLLAIGLTALTFAGAVVFTPLGPIELVDAWQGPRGFFGLLGFSMQMCLVLVTGYALASAPLVQRLFARVAEWPKTASMAGAMVAAIAMAFALLNWGLGLMVGAILSRRVAESAARRGLVVHYPLLAAAGYTGMLVWHGGFSGTAPLKVTTRQDLVELLGPELGASVPTISIFDTLLSPLNLFTTLGLCVLVPILVYAMTPPAADSVSIELDEGPPAEASGAKGETAGWPWRLEQSPLVTLVLAVPLLAYLVRYFHAKGVSNLDLNVVNLTLLTAGLVFHVRPRAYLSAVESAVKSCAGIILQFPLYGGIMGIMATSGLAKSLASAAVLVSTPKTYAVITFLSAGLINLFVPSGGGQWAIQGPIAVEAARELGLSLETAVMAVAYGDQWTNMLQPFWALPLLGLTGVRAADIMGYTAVVFLVSGAWFVALLFVFG